jgi:hypothetical protein
MTQTGPYALNPRHGTPEPALHGAPALARLKPQGYGFYGQTFIRDLQEMHSALRPELTFDGVDREIAERIIMDLLGADDLYGDRRRDTTHSFLEFLARVAAELCFSGRCTTELFRTPKVQRTDTFPLRRTDSPTINKEAAHDDEDRGGDASASRAKAAGDSPDGSQEVMAANSRGLTADEPAHDDVDASTADDPRPATQENPAPGANRDPSEQPATIQIAIVPDWSTRNRRGNLQQIRELDDGNTGWHTIPRASLGHIDFSDDLGRRLSTTFRRLVIADAHRQGARDVINAAGGSRKYDRELHRRLADELTARVTRSVGWDGGGVLDARATTTHKNYRKLRFLDTWLTLVQGVLDHINSIVSNPELFPDSPFTMSLDGLPTRARVAEAARNLSAGTESNDDIFWGVLHNRKDRQM